MEAHTSHAGAHLHQPPGPPKSKALGMCFQLTASTPTSGADTGPWLAGQAERQEARRTVGQSQPEARGHHQPLRPPH